MRQMLRIGRAIAERRWHWVLVTALVFLLAWAWANRFVQDDAFISFRYARNLANGQGLTWNAGERVEGYTNFLWVLLMAVPIKLGLEPVAAAFGLGMVCYALSLWLTYSLAAALLRSRWWALLTVILLGVNHTFSAYATGGLETQLQTCILLGAAYLGLRAHAAPEGRRTALHAGVSLCTSAALLTRLDSAVALVPLYATLLLGLLRRRAGASAPAEGSRPGIRATILHVVALCGPALLIVGGWLLWKLSYYGGILPNTYYAKASSPSIRQGVAYAYRFVTFYWLAPFILLGLAQLGRTRSDQGGHAREQRSTVAVLALTVALWTAYVIGVGGDFMEFRFFVPILPSALVLAVWVVGECVQEPRVRAALVTSVALAGLLAASGYKGYGGVESIAQLEGHLTNANENWIGVGRALQRLFGDRSGVMIATTAAGAIPYYSGLDTVDMLGLNDPWVAREGSSAGSRAGHQKLAPFAYLLERQVNLVIGHPRVGLLGTGKAAYSPQELEYFALTPVDTASLPENATVLEIPLGDTYALTLLYLTPSPAVDEAILAHSLVTYPIVR
jgi:arabinofuranosyltransferase